MILHCVKLERAVIFIKGIASLVPIIFPLKNVMWYKMGLPALKLAEPSRADEKWTIEYSLRKYLAISFFASDLSRLTVIFFQNNDN